MPDNITTLDSLTSLAKELHFQYHILDSTSSPPPPESAQLLFVLNFTTAQRSYLLTSNTTLALLYTPANEHFGIVPIEAMACGLPVLAADSGGPTETILDLDEYGDRGTGLLRKPTPEDWAPALAFLIDLPSDRREKIAKSAKGRVRDHFSSDTLGKELEDACREALRLGDLHTQLGDRLIWGGGMLVVTSGVMLGLTIWMNS